MRHEQRRGAACCTLAASLSLLLGCGEQSAVQPIKSAQTLKVERAKRITVSKVAALTGPDATTSTRDVDICGTDLGTMAEVNGKVLFAFGDTFGFNGADCPKFGPNWRSNVLGVSADLDPSDGVTWERWLADGDGKAVAVREGAHQPPFTGEQTKIPTAMIGVGGRLYLHLMSVHGFDEQGGVWQCNASKFVFSDDEGRTWTDAARDFGGRGSNFNMLALTGERGGGNADGGYIYALGTPCGRFGDAQLARVRPGAVAQNDAWEYLSAVTPNGTPRWDKSPLQAIDVIPGPIGEASILWNPYLKRWMYTYLNERTAALELREAKTPWGPWSEPHVLATAVKYPQLYGAFMTPAYLKNGGKTFYFMMSQFGPYNVYVMKASIQN